MVGAAIATCTDSNNAVHPSFIHQRKRIILGEIEGEIRRSNRFLERSRLGTHSVKDNNKNANKAVKVQNPATGF